MLENEIGSAIESHSFIYASCVALQCIGRCLLPCENKNKLLRVATMS